jgi:hypothetical protein
MFVFVDLQALFYVWYVEASMIYFHAKFNNSSSSNPLSP